MEIEGKEAHETRELPVRNIIKNSRNTIKNTRKMQGNARNARNARQGADRNE